LQAATIAREAGALVSFDVNYRPTLWRRPDEALAQVAATIPYADVLKVNEGELALLSSCELDLDAEGWEDRVDAASESLLDRGPTLIIITLGPHGALFRTRSASGFAPGFSVQTVDATGCGDAFIAGLLWQLVRERPGLTRPADSAPGATAELLPEILRYANAVGALTATRQGVIPALPTAAEVEAFLLAQP
jgi:fructokinase